MPSQNNKGIALYLVLAILAIVVMIANIVLNLVATQSRFTYHHTSRIQAYYATQMGVSWALDRLSSGDPNWNSAAAFNKMICRQATFSASCNVGGNITEPDLPAFINSVNITVTAPSAQGIRNITVSTIYTYN